MRHIKWFLVISSLFFVLATSVPAQSFVITGNGDGSGNNVIFDASSNNVIHQSNTVDVTNNINANANTGGNSINNGNGGTIKTGDAKVNVSVTNNLNNNTANIVCCETPTPKPTYPPVTVTVTPTPTSNNRDGDGGHSGPGSSSGSSGGGQVLGLSGTSGEPWGEYLMYGFGTVCLIAAKKILITRS